MSWSWCLQARSNFGPFDSSVPPTPGPQHAWYIQRNLRAGVVEEHPAHTIVVAGDVKQGASVIAGGNILVFGKSACTADDQPASPATGPVLLPGCPVMPSVALQAAGRGTCRLQGQPQCHDHSP